MMQEGEFDLEGHEPATQAHEYLGFLLDGEGYAIPIDGVVEIMKPLPITPVPGSRPEVLGLMSVRGRLSTVFSLRACLDLGPRRVDGRSRVLLVETLHEQVGFLVDEVRGVFRAEPDSIEAPSVFGGDPGPHVRGAARPDGDLVVLLDVAPLIDGPAKPLALRSSSDDDDFPEDS